MIGKIVKGIAGFYYVDVNQVGVYQCRARGIFRNQKIKPLIGDNVRIEVTHEQDMEGNVLEILPRKNALIRPTVSNVDQAFVVFSVAHPEPNLNLLDRFLIAVMSKNIEAIICFNKIDLLNSLDNEVVSMYKHAGYKVIMMSAVNDEQRHLEKRVERIEEMMKGKTTVFAGPSGVGKSTIINLIQEHTHMETGSISDKIKRGKHTTRHANLIPIDQQSYVVDTPGFSSLQLDDLEPEQVKEYFIEFASYEPMCKFAGCNHINEPKCGVKEALAAGDIHPVRYENYLHIYNELKEKRKY
ncbi:ribosome small subunit-dependent GTPase A [Vallitaleaceae bacterium 9-2]